MTEPRLTDADIAAFEPDAKIALLATVDPAGLPHLTLITTLTAKGPTRLMFGQFTEGRSKRHLRDEPKAGWLVMNADKQVWRGRARWTGTATEGADFEAFNRRPIYRYNSYFGIHTVHYLDLVSTEPTAKLDMVGVVGGALKTAALRLTARRPEPHPVLKPWATGHLADMTTLKYLAWVDDEGWPVVVPVVPAHPAGTSRLVLAPTVFKADLKRLKPGAPLAVLALNLKLESVLVRGAFAGWRGLPGLRSGVLDIDFVYNSLPPVHGQVYPELPLEAVAAR
jgi:hypothetical protein